ncbi:MAG: hypothetical protein JWP25_7498 [Bradyrhizobium sp.]|nr:hypothetical protein [Bradyrhizobium sp.]
MRVVFCSGANLKQIHGDLQSRFFAINRTKKSFAQFLVLQQRVIVTTLWRWREFNLIVRRFGTILLRG